MPTSAKSNSVIVSAYRERTPSSAALAQAAQEVFPSGLTHDSRHLRPYAVYVERAAGSRKWDVDGNRYVDYFGGHGALLLGHNHPHVMRAVEAALTKGTHFGASHPLEVRWGQLVREMVPSAERVRFTSSGTEATHLAVRLARAYTGRRKILRFRTHFHGWHDHMTSGYSAHFDGSPTPGVLAEVAESVILLTPGDIDAFRTTLEADSDIAAVFIEPTGASFGMVPVRPEFLTAVRELTAKHGTLLIFDEVISGFRVAPGGAQARFGILPDLTTLAKVLAGGLPGGAIVGRKDVLDLLDFEAARANGREKVSHQGTFNANPLSAAAGSAALETIHTTGACEAANAFAAKLRAEMNEILVEERVPWAVYGTFSEFHIFTNPKQRPIAPGSFDPCELDYEELKAKPADLVNKLRIAMLINGVDITGWPGGLASAVHDDDDLRTTVSAFAKALRMLRQDGEI